MGGCKSVFVGNPARKAEKKKEMEKKKFNKSYRDAVTAHYNLQTKETRKRMKKNLKKAEARSKKNKPAKGWDCR
jgi:hypothetical protein